MVQVDLVGVSKSFPDGTQALTDVSLEIGAGERLVIVGPSGCGKTTLLRILAGLETASKGQIFFDSQDVTPVPSWKRKAAWLSQRPTLLPHLSVRDNLAFPLDLQRGFWRRRRKSEEEKNILTLAQALGLEDLLDRPTAQLSGGQQQRVALGRAWLQPSRLRLLDEPLAQLDAPLRWQLRREIPLLQRQFPSTIIVVTHDPEEALALGERIAVLDRGRLVQCGLPGELLENPASRFVADFFQTQSGPINFLEGNVLISSGRRCFEVEAFRWPLPEHRAWPLGPGLLGILARDIYIKAGSLPGQLAARETGGDWMLGICTTPVGSMVVRLRQPEGDLMVGQAVQLDFCLDRAFLFEPKAGLRTC